MANETRYEDFSNHGYLIPHWNRFRLHGCLVIITKRSNDYDLSLEVENSCLNILNDFLGSHFLPGYTQNLSNHLNFLPDTRTTRGFLRRLQTGCFHKHPHSTSIDIDLLTLPTVEPCRIPCPKLHLAKMISLNSYLSILDLDLGHLVHPLAFCFGFGVGPTPRPITEKASPATPHARFRSRRWGKIPNQTCGTTVVYPHTTNIHKPDPIRISL